MNQNGDRPFPTIHTERFTLRRAFPSDVKALIDLTHDEEVMRYYGMAPYETQEEALDELNWFNGLFDDAKGIRWIIADRLTGSYIGDVGLFNYIPDHARAELGLKLAKAYWRRGIMAEAVEHTIAYGLAEMRLNRIEAVVDPRNEACLGLLSKAGFQKEGLLREYEREQGGFVDLVMLSILRRDRDYSPLG
jgi:[ribosomal protein S5]-alanine N-acetyltransferase